MDDSFLNDLRRPPSPEFAERLRATLKAQPVAAPPVTRRWLTPRVAMWGASIAGVALLFTIPAVRASAQAFLDLFRVVNFVAVPVDPDRLARLRSEEIDLPRLIGEQVTVLTEPGAPVTVTSVAAARAAAGTEVRMPSTVPDGLSLMEIRVTGERAARVTADMERLRQLLESLAISDIEIPAELNGQSATVRVPPTVELRYENQEGVRRVRLLQSQSPTVSMPAGLNLPQLGEIGLRILGLDASEARRLAADIDWHSTLLVPMPPDVTSFRHVQVGTARGLAFETPVGTNAQGRRERISFVIWSKDGHVFGMQGNVGLGTLLEMANSVQ
ncbi:MAG: hypothetical protein ACRDF6_12290 [bacterium]